MNSLHPKIKFTIEEESTESSSSFAFLDVQIMRSGDKFYTRTYYKPTYTGLYTNWFSFTPRKFKINLVKCLLSRAWKICSNRILFEKDWYLIKHNLLKNQYPEPLVNALHKNFINSKLIDQPTDTVLTVPKKEVLLILPYHGTHLSNKLQKSLLSLFSNTYPQVDLRFIFRTTWRISNLFSYKDNIPTRLKSFVVYRVQCTNCDAFYVGKTKRHMATRFKEHQNPRKTTAVTEHLLRNNHEVQIDNVSFLATGKSDTELLIKESLLVKKLSPPLNAMVSSFPLELF